MATSLSAQPHRRAEHPHSKPRRSRLQAISNPRMLSRRSDRTDDRKMHSAWLLLLAGAALTAAGIMVDPAGAVVLAALLFSRSR